MEKVNSHCVSSQENKWMASIRHQHQQCKNNRKGNQIHHSSDYHSLHIVHSTCKVGMVASEKVHRNIISDHIIGRHKQQNDHEKCNHDLAFKFADHLGVFILP